MQPVSEPQIILPKFTSLDEEGPREERKELRRPNNDLIEEMEPSTMGIDIVLM